MTEQSPQSPTPSGTGGTESSRPTEPRPPVDLPGTSPVSRRNRENTTTLGDSFQAALSDTPKRGLLRIDGRFRDPKSRLFPEKSRSSTVTHPLLRSVMRSCCFGTMPWPLVLLGSAGCGKTCAALAMSDFFSPAAYFPAAEMASKLNDCRFGRHMNSIGEPMSEAEFWAEWVRNDLTILDELGTREKVSDALYETIKRAIDSRQGKASILISNMGLDQLGKVYDDRIASRLTEGTVVELRGDRRVGQPVTTMLADATLLPRLVQLGEGNRPVIPRGPWND